MAIVDTIRPGPLGNIGRGDIGVERVDPPSKPQETNLESLVNRVEPECLVTTDPHLILEARQLTTRYYLKRNFITKDQVAEDGTIKHEFDPHHDDSEYYVALDPETGRVAATVRKIMYTPEKGKRSFPLFDHENELDEEYREQLDAIGPENLVEISALVKEPSLDPDGTIAMKLYKRLFLDEWSKSSQGDVHASNDKTYIMACNPILFKNFKYIFNGSIKRIGPDLDYPGQIAVPAMLPLREGAVNLINNVSNKKNSFRNAHKIIIDFFLDGADAETLHPDIIRALLDNGFDYTLSKIKNSDVEYVAEDKRRKTMKDLRGEIAKAVVVDRVKSRSAEIAATAGILGWTALRTLGVAEGIDLYSDVDWRVFLGIDLVTAPLYGYGAVGLVRSARKPEVYSNRYRLTSAAALGAAVTAPYAYLAAEGDGTPEGYIWGVGVLAALSAASAARKVHRSQNPKHAPQHRKEGKPSYFLKRK